MTTVSQPGVPEGVRAFFVVPESMQGWRLDKVLEFLPELEAHGLRVRRRLCEHGLITVNGKSALPGLKLRAGQTIALLYEEEDTAESDLGVRLIHTEHELAAVFKPAGLHSAALAGSATPSLQQTLPALLDACPEGFPQLLNRLDQPTSGMVLAALSEEGAKSWRRAENVGRTDKRYLAIIEQQPLYEFTVARRLDTDSRIRTRVRHTDDPDTFRHTDVTLLHGFTASEVALPGAAKLPADLPLMLVGCRIRKGARHQIRAHLAAAGHPLLGDSLYHAAYTLDPPYAFFLHHGGIQLPEFKAICLPEWSSCFPDQIREKSLNWLNGVTNELLQTA